MFRVVLITALLGACVPKARHLEELGERERALRAMQDLAETERGERAALLAALENEQEATSALQDRIRALDAEGESQRGQLKQLSEQIAAMATSSAAQRERKAELEAVLNTMEQTAEASRAEAEAAKRHVAELDAERARLEAEAARLAAEKGRLESRTAAYDSLVSELEAEISGGQITITELSGKLTVNVSNAILFASGKTAVKPDGEAALARVAEVLAGVKDREIRVEGHTDDVPVGSGAPYPDNWALSSLRASTVVAILVDGGVDPENIAAVGFGEHRPTVPNQDAEGRATNRRTEIVLVPRLAVRAVPQEP